MDLALVVLLMATGTIVLMIGFVVEDYIRTYSRWRNRWGRK